MLRARAGDTVAVVDDSGWEYVVALEEVHPQQTTGGVIERRRPPAEPGVAVTLYQGVMKGEKFDLVLQKGTELGVSTFVPVLCARSVPRWRESASEAGRRSRWARILTEAAEQSQRGRVPGLKAPLAFVDACSSLVGAGIIPFEGEHRAGLKDALQSVTSGDYQVSGLGVFIGPEGGFTGDEVEHARSVGILPVTMGKRILRAETAAVAAVAAVMYELGELGGHPSGG